MRPLRLELEGFGAFRDPCAVDLTDIELVALVGATGAGKSTIIDAITFALYGSVARYDDNRAVAPVINQTSTRARVRLDFEVGEHRYTAVRLVQRTARGATTKEARLERGDDLLAGDAKSMSAEVGRLLGLDVDQFNRTVVLPQGRFADFLHDSPADRQATLRQLLGLGIYQRVAGVARQRAAALRSQVDALRPDLDDGSRELTDEHRARLVTRCADVTAARTSFIAALDRLAPLTTTLDGLDRRLAELDASLALVAGVRAPDGLAALDERAGAADAAVEQALAALLTTRERRRVADGAVERGPDLAACTAQLHRRREAAAATSEHERSAAALAAAEARQSDAQVVAAGIVAARAELDARVVARRAAEQDARRMVDTGPNQVQVEHWIALRSRRVAMATEVDGATAAADEARRAVTTTTADLEAAETAEAGARARRDDLQQRAGAAGFVALLHVGAPCPLCLHDVEVIPEHHVSDDLDRAAAELVASSEASAAVRQQLRMGERDVAERRAAADAARRALSAIDEDLGDAPGDEELRARLARSVELCRALEAATAELEVADAAAAAHRTDPENVNPLAIAEAAAASVARLRAVVEDQRQRVTALVAALAGVPAEGELESAIVEAERLSDERQAAAAAHDEAEAARDEAVAARTAIDIGLRNATSELLSARDRVGALGPPALAGERPAAGWAVLAAWATDRHRELTKARDVMGAERDVTAKERDDVERVARERCATVLAATDEGLPELRDRLAQAQTAAAGAIAAFDERRERLGALRARVDALTEDARVATHLGHLLRAAGFEAWLMEAALDDLVAGATVRLRELSSGQFSLELVEREFMVRDHANADELRSARTLSGGETFLASLSLALALAEATSDLSSEGAPAMESIFLDEGFGTLDPSTLDVVAGAIEELGSTGRMVAVVTHIRELADRMPVRLEVTKSGASASVERVDA